MAREKDPAGHGEQSASDDRVAPAPKRVLQGVLLLAQHTPVIHLNERHRLRESLLCVRALCARSWSAAVRSAKCEQLEGRPHARVRMREHACTPKSESFDRSRMAWNACEFAALHYRR